jgi:septal ring factor EnvC (AmiA/AmiB activator)
MNARKIILVSSVLCLAVLLTGCGPSAAAQLKKTQADLTACNKQAGELQNEIVKAQDEVKKLTKERDGAAASHKLLAKKVGMLEQQLANNDKATAALKDELEKSKKTIDEMKAAAEKAAAAPASPATPAVPAPGMPQ